MKSRKGVSRLLLTFGERRQWPGKDDNCRGGGKGSDFKGKFGYKISEENRRIKDNSKILDLNNGVKSGGIHQDREDSEKTNFRFIVWSSDIYTFIVE